MDDNVTAVLIVAISILGVICLRYMKMKTRSSGQMSTRDQLALEQMMQTAQRLEQRVNTLERIRDAEVPSWRSDFSGQMGMMAGRSRA
jgi:phage shock protein B